MVHFLQSYSGKLTLRALFEEINGDSLQNRINFVTLFSSGIKQSPRFING